MRCIMSGSIRCVWRRLGLPAAIAAALLCAMQAGAQTPTAWTNISGGVWSNSTCWSNDVPSNNIAFITATGASYTITYDAPANSFSNLTIFNSAGYTSTLTITSTAFAPIGNVVLSTGAVVNVNNGGVWGSDLNTNGYVSLVVTAGASLNINGGTMLYTNLVRGSVMSLSDASSSATSVLNITSGYFEFSGTNDAYSGTEASSPYFNLGVSKPGVINISGGKCVVQKLYGWNVGSGSGGRGYVNITGGELVVTGQSGAASGPYCAIAYGTSYGEVNVSGNGRATLYVRQWAVGGYNGDGRFNVNGGTATVNGTIYIGYRGINSTGIVQVTAGELHATSHIYLGNEPYNNNYYDTGILNVYGGTATVDGSVMCGQTAASNMANRIARITVTNGLLYIKGSLTVAETTKFFATNYAELNLSGSGIITNVGSITVGLCTNAIGVINQTGGMFDQNVNSSYVYLGDKGGSGTFNMSGGLFQNKYWVYVGGKTGSNSVGALNISGGTFQVNAQPLYIGEAGTGTLNMAGSQGTFTGPALVATTSTSRINFDLGPNGAGTVTVSGAVSIGTNANLTMTVTDYDWSANGLNVDLISYGTLTGTFGTNVTLIGAAGRLDGGSIDYGDGTDDKIRLQLRPAVGTIFYMR